MSHFSTNKTSYLIIIIFGLFFFYVCLDRQQAYYDIHATMDTARAIIESDAVNHKHQFHTWRVSGNISYVVVLNLLFGFEGATRAVHYFSVLWVVLALLLIFRLSYLWLGEKSTALPIALTATIPVILHYTPTGTQDVMLLALPALMIWVLADTITLKEERWRYVLFVFATTFAISVRLTFVGFSFLLLFAMNFKKCSWKQLVWRQWPTVISLILALMSQLLILVALRGREFGWYTFYNGLKGMVGAHTGQMQSTDFIDSHWDIFTSVLWGVGPLLFVLGLLGMGLAIRKKEEWSWLLGALTFWMFAHVIIIPMAHTRYYIPLILVLVICSSYVIKSFHKTAALTFLFLLGAQGIYALSIEIPYNLLESQKRHLAQELLDVLEKDWHPKKDQIYWRGQLFTTVTTEDHFLPEDAYYNIHSVGPSSFNYGLKHHVRHWYPKKMIGWSKIDVWSKGVMDKAIIEKAMDGDIFIISPARGVYKTKQMKPIGSFKDIEKLHPIEGELTHQLPLVVQRVRRRFLKEGEKATGPYIWKERNESLQGRELIWVDKLQLFDRNGKKLLKN